tara:strand:+ start:561 stop:1550 length:990 start_codon:yes stop_codon:yes gene_type:complete
MVLPGLLLTGFTPFSIHAENISQDIIEEISINGIEGLEVETMLLSVDEKGSRDPSERISAGAAYTAILHLGFSPESEIIKLEKFGRNGYCMQIPDNSRRQIESGTIVAGAPEVIATSSPEHVIDESLDDFDRISWSEDAGGYVCNETYYRTLLAVSESEHPSTPVLFMHLPDETVIPISVQISVVSRISRFLCKRPHFEVASALVFDERHRILACRRPPGDKWAGMWEFPGGKIEDQESSRDAIIREINEELQVSIEPSHIISEIRHSYEDRDVSMHLWYCGIITPEAVKPTEHDKVRWLSREELLEVDWLPADVPVVESWYENGIPVP